MGIEDMCDRDSIPPDWMGDLSREYASGEDELKELLERARVVGVLDAWASCGTHRSWGMSDYGGVDLYGDASRGQPTHQFEGPPDAARAAAAKAIEAGEV